jgi:hypothetical protein
MHSLLILMILVGLIFAPGVRRVFFRTLSGVFGLIACVLTIVWAAGSGSGRRSW